MPIYLGVDVGTASVRAAAINIDSEKISMLCSKVRPITIWSEKSDHHEQSSDEIWNAVCEAVKTVLSDIKVDPVSIRGIGFDATCSLVVLDKQMQPLAVSEGSTNNARNIIMWMDHRAKAETDEINQTEHKMLKFVGGTMSIEMQMPKILWIKRNLIKTWPLVGALMDLPDYLTYRATSHSSRSLCSVVCKWAYDACSGDLSDHGWNRSFLEEIGLGDLVTDGFEILGSQVYVPGHPIPNGLSGQAAVELGLVPGTPVGASLIDAHAGAIGLLACSPSDLPHVPPTSRIGLICGTSSCHMMISRDPLFVPGVWGPYFSAALAGSWLNEGGQSVTGRLLDFILESSSAYAQLTSIVGDTDKHVFMAARALELAEDLHVPIHALAKDVHVWPDFHGNRSPLADPNMRGMICGLKLSSSVDDLVILYVSAMQSLIYGTKHIIETMRESGHDICAGFMCGGLTKNKLYIQMSADALEFPVIIPEESQSVLVGAAILGVCADRGVSIEQVLQTVHNTGTVVIPDSSAAAYHRKKYTVFKMMMQHQLAYRDVMSD